MRGESHRPANSVTTVVTDNRTQVVRFCPVAKKKVVVQFVDVGHTPGLLLLVCC